MIVRAVDNNNDWVFGRGKQSYKRDQEAVMQSIKTRLLSYYGNCFFDTEAGVDWQRLLGTPGVDEEIRLSCRSVIARTPGVLRVNEISVAKDGRRISLQYSVDTEYTQNVTATTEVGSYA